MRKTTKGKSAFVSRKMIITILLIVSFAMTSSTFAYWADVVVGAEIEATSTFVVGSPIYDNHEFVLNDNVSSYRYLIDLEELLEDPGNITDEIVFGVSFDDLDLSDELKEKISTGEVEIHYELIIYKNNKEISDKNYDKYGSLIEVEEGDNPEELTYMDYPKTFRVFVTLEEDLSKKEIRKLAKYEAYIEISFEIDDIEIDGIDQGIDFDIDYDDFEDEDDEDDKKKDKDKD